MDYNIKGKAAIVGIGETTYYKRGGSPVSEFRLACEAILKAAADAGIDVRDIDGFCSYSNDRNDPPRIASAFLGSSASARSKRGWRTALMAGLRASIVAPHAVPWD